MKKIILTFEMYHELVGMRLEVESDNPTREEETVSGQMIDQIVQSKGVRSPVVARGSGETIEEAKKDALLMGDIYLSGVRPDPDQ